MYKVTLHRVVGNEDGIFISNEPNLESACRIATAIFEGLKICSDKNLLMYKRDVPVGAAIEIFDDSRTRSGYSRNYFIAYIRCQEMPDEREEKENIPLGRP